MNTATAVSNNIFIPAPRITGLSKISSESFHALPGFQSWEDQTLILHSDQKDIYAT
jgi:hypothetical protein